MSYQPQTFTFDISKQRIGANIGGDCGAVIACPVCSKPACAVRTGFRKGKPFTEYAHAVSITSGCASKPEQAWENVCTYSKESG